MQIILLTDIANLGHKDDVINVKPGYGRNYLIPQGYAILATEAAKKIAKAEKEKTSKKPSNKPNVFVRMGKAIKNFFKNSKGDLKKITWPGAKEVLKGTVVTIVCIAIVGVLVFLVDLGLTKGISGLRTVAENRTTTTVAETTTASEKETTTAGINIVTDSSTTAAQ